MRTWVLGLIQGMKQWDEVHAVVILWLLNFLEGVLHRDHAQWSS